MEEFSCSMFWQGGGLSDFVVGAFDMDAFEEGRTYRNAWGYFNDRWHKADYTNPESEWIPGYFGSQRYVCHNNQQTGIKLLDVERKLYQTKNIEIDTIP